jgi:hypothetical protein
MALDQALQPADHTDINEANVHPAVQRQPPGTNLGSETAEERGQSEIEGVTMTGGLWPCAAPLALAGVPALAHHSFAMFDQRKLMTLEGTVHEFQWTNPHAFIELDVTSGGRRSAGRSSSTAPTT